MANQTRNLEFLTHTARWPFWPLCPLKRQRKLDDNSSVQELAILVDFDPPSGLLRLYTHKDVALNIFTFDLVMPPSGCTCVEVTPGQVVQQGWEVD